MNFFKKIVRRKICGRILILVFLNKFGPPGKRNNAADGAQKRDCRPRNESCLPAEVFGYNRNSVRRGGAAYIGAGISNARDGGNLACKAEAAGKKGCEHRVYAVDKSGNGCRNDKANGRRRLIEHREHTAEHGCNGVIAETCLDLVFKYVVKHKDSNVGNDYVKYRNKHG